MYHVLQTTCFKSLNSPFGIVQTISWSLTSPSTKNKIHFCATLKKSHQKRSHDVVSSFPFVSAISFSRLQLLVAESRDTLIHACGVLHLTQLHSCEQLY